MKQLIDIEVFKNYFLLGTKDYVTKEIKSFEVSEYKDERLQLYKWLCDTKGFVISFNGIHYDTVVLGYIKESWEELKYLDSLNFCLFVKRFSDLIINDDWEQIKTYRFVFSKQWNDIDLFLYWSKGLRQSKKISLKGLGIQLKYSVVMELPFHPDTFLKEDEIQQIKEYNLKHDLGILELVTEVFEGKSNTPLGNLGTIQLRATAVKEYGINAWSWDPPKIASEVLLKEYCKKTRQNPKDVRELRYSRDTIYFKELFGDSFQFKTPLFKSVYEEWMNSVNTFSKEFVINTESGHGLKISCGIGGIHNILSDQIYTKEKGYKIIDIDIESLYPQFIQNFKSFRFPEVLDIYLGFKDFRVTQTKPNIKKYKGTSEEQKWKDIDSFYKVILNGVSGYLDMEYSWLYYPKGIMKVRCGGQLTLLTIIEECWLNNVTIIQVNTDGLTVKIEEDKIKWFESIVKEAERKFNVKFEFAEYEKMIFRSVNSYLAMSEKGSPKKKGEFVTNPELGNSVNFLVIPKCLELYFVKGIKPETVLESPEQYGLYIYDFCAAFKCSKDYTVLWNNEKQQRLNRFYVSKNAPYLYKQKSSKSKPDNMLKGWGVQLFNNYEKKPFEQYKIDKTFYLSEINKLISEIEHHNQLSLF